MTITLDRPRTTASNAGLIADMKTHYGPIHTGGLGAVTFRYDHYLNVFDRLIRTMHEERGIKYALALDSRRWEDPQNNLVHRRTVNEWAKRGLTEIWNHGTNHEDHSGYDNLHDFIVNAKHELEYDLPDANIWGFAVPGVAGTRLDGFRGGRDLAVFTGTTAGQLIMENHAVSTGAIPGSTQRIMDGTVKQGQFHYNIEKQNAKQIIVKIDQAISGGTALTLMMHPLRLTQAGCISRGTLTTVLDYVHRNIHAGNLANLGMYESLVATA